MNAFNDKHDVFSIQHLQYVLEYLRELTMGLVCDKRHMPYTRVPQATCIRGNWLVGIQRQRRQPSHEYGGHSW